MSKQEIIQEIEQLGSTDENLKDALSPLLLALQSGMAAEFVNLVSSGLGELADDYEKIGFADAATKLRQIDAKLKML